MTNKDYIDLDRQYYLQTFARFPVVLDHGEGSRVWDADGKEYIDTLAGIAVNALGHNHPVLVGRIQEQAAALLHVSNFYLSKPQAELSRKLVKHSGLDRVFFTNSGAESVEGAVKIARKYAHSIGRGGEIISFTGAFHGRTLATLAATGKKKMQEGFEPIPSGFRQLPFNDISALQGAVTNDTAAFILELIQGEGGINEADPAFVRELRAICDRHRIALIFDEIQTGIGRTGKMFAFEHYGIKPDIMTLAKALGGGVPVGAILSNNEVSDAINYGDHGTTFGGNPLACAASLAVLEVIEKEYLLKEAERKGAWFKERIRSQNLRGLKEIRGKGLMIGIEFDFETKPLVERMLEHGVLANATAGHVLRFVPALNITANDLEKVIDALKVSLKEI